MSVALNNVQAAQAFTASSKRWGVPFPILWGVAGLESGWGSNMNTSSAGAKGLMQFIGATGDHYSYPPTNTPSADEMRQQIDSAAHYLHDLFNGSAYTGAPKGTWDAALRAYSNGGYGEADVLKKANSPEPGNPGINLQKGILTVAGIGAAAWLGSKLGGAGKGVVSKATKLLPEAAGAAGAITLTGLLTNIGLWKGVGFILAGVLVLIFAALEVRKLA